MVHLIKSKSIDPCIGIQQKEEEQQPKIDMAVKRNQATVIRKDEVPVFLRKTWDLINSCNETCPDTACWSYDGRSFLVKDQEKFASKIIPQYFRRHAEMHLGRLY